MTAADLPAVLALEAELFIHPWSESAFLTRIDAGQHCRVLELSGAPVGYLVAASGGGQADLLQVAVAPAQQRQGFARRLIAELFSALAGEGVEALFLEVRAGNRAAIACYRALGFEQTGLRRGYYPDGAGREDAVLMKKELVVDAST